MIALSINALDMLLIDRVVSFSGPLPCTQITQTTSLVPLLAQAQGLVVLETEEAHQAHPFYVALAVTGVFQITSLAPLLAQAVNVVARGCCRGDRVGGSSGDPNEGTSSG